VVVGYRLEDDAIILRSGTTRRLIMKVDHFLATWRRADSWAMIVLHPGELPQNPDADRFLNAVNAFETSGRIKPAEAAYRAAHVAWPQNQTAMFALGNNLLLQGSYREAASVFKDLLAINPDHIAAGNNLAEILARHGCYPQALAKIEQAVKTAEKNGSALTEIVLKTQQQIKQQMNRNKPAECTIVSNTSD
jgi:tetratricopeptide (TPR) repeat protein